MGTGRPVIPTPTHAAPISAPVQHGSYDDDTDRASVLGVTALIGGKKSPLARAPYPSRHQLKTGIKPDLAISEDTSNTHHTHIDT
jgi:hypothetical protein